MKEDDSKGISDFQNEIEAKNDRPTPSPTVLELLGIQLTGHPGKDKKILQELLSNILEAGLRNLPPGFWSKGFEWPETGKSIPDNNSQIDQS